MSSVNRTTNGKAEAHRTEARLALSFSGHETFVFRYGWLTKACRAVTADAEVFSSEWASVRLGVGKNMVRSIRHWALAAGVLDEEPGTRGGRLFVTHFGRILLAESGLDPYLEDPGTLWLIHWNLLRSPNRCTTWKWAFHKLPSNDFTRDSLAQLIRNELNLHQFRDISDGVLRRDVEVFTRTYVPSRAAKNTVIEDTLDCPLVELGLVTDVGSGHFQFVRGDKPTLSSEVFLYCLAEFWDEVARDQQTLSLSDIAYREGSPGSVFKLDETSVLLRLEALAQLTGGKWFYEETSGVRQVYRRSRVDREAMLERYFLDSRMPAGGVA